MFEFYDKPIVATVTAIQLSITQNTNIMKFIVSALF